MTMNGQMTKYEKYLGSLEEMKEPKPADLVFDMRGAVEYAEKKGIRISEFSQEETDMFVKPKQQARLA